MKEMILSIGLCLGASTVSLVQLRRQAGGTAPDKTHKRSRPIILSHGEYPHEGNPRKTLQKVLEAIPWNDEPRIAVTGRKFRHFLNLTSISEPEAVEHAVTYTKPEGITCPAVISAGGETFMVYTLDPHGRITNVLTGNKCAAGTGEFFLQQLRRMNVSLEEAAQWSAETEPYHVSGRCSVFCKSDCTHATNKGIPRARVTAGLGRMMASKVLELLKKVERRNLMLVGGTAHNQMMVRYIRQAVENLIVPDQAPYFEALGAALWALDHPTRPFPGKAHLFARRESRFDTLPPLKRFISGVTFETIPRDSVRAGDVCLLGLDVGSTTTKAVLLRQADNVLLASIYLRTNGDPVGASRKCYRAILEQVSACTNPAEITIVGLGVCGSGRQIAGLHALTDGVINEIIAHATAAVYFDRDVDTIFEIGGQDAKYTYITNGVPSDYAMNEACSAGTGSFLEESALETLGIPMEEIADRALKGEQPPNFNDQCAAFIASDIKNAVHDGVAHTDIVAGLVYSICMNYNNRVKGNRPVGRKVFMQGGVCYNRAVPLAMAALIDKPIIVPPEPGLMGAFGAALEVKKRMAGGLLQPNRYDLETLAERQVVYKQSFICKGGKERCDRRCEIARIAVDGNTYPFGGACNRYDNLRRKQHFDVTSLDLVRTRQQLVFGKYAPAPLDPAAPGYRGSIGLNRSFMVNTYFPLYAHFFSTLGFAPLIPDTPSTSGIDRRNAPFCYPGELAHGFFYSLINTPEPPKAIFLPHFKSVPTLNENQEAQVCPLVQGEPFYLGTTFRERLNRLKPLGLEVLSPLIDLAAGLEGARRPLVDAAVRLGVPAKEAHAAFERAMSVMDTCQTEMREIGRQALETLDADPSQMAVVIFSRPYSGYVPEANMGIPHKFASRGIMVLPLDFLDPEDNSGHDYMYWGMGQRILTAAQYIRDRDNLFGTYITNFSCGPDSFLVGYFRDIMGRKPSLTLELDSHTADAGLETRIEAFLDIVQAYRRLKQIQPMHRITGDFQPARIAGRNGSMGVMTSGGQWLPHTDSRVTMVFPSMGDLGTKAIAQAFKYIGFNVFAHAPSDEKILKLGRGNTSCKECLPLMLTTGMLLDYVRHRRRSDEVVLYFMPTGSGPCRFGQYRIFMEKLVYKLQLPDVAVFSLSSDDGYDGFPTSVHRRAWWAVIVSDVCEDIRTMLLANARQPDRAMAIFNDHYQRVLEVLASGGFGDLAKTLDHMAKTMATIDLKQPIDRVPTISITGEIFVRRDGLSRQHLSEYLASQGFASTCAPVAEWVLYSDYVINKGLSGTNHTGWRNKLNSYIKQSFMRKDEKRIKKLLSSSGLVHARPIKIDDIVATATTYISPYLGGEAVLTVGSSLKEVAEEACGVIAIGPFGCMPNRLSEAILNETMKRSDKLSKNPDNELLRSTLLEIDNLPFLAIESDGSPFPQLIHAKLEAFCLRARRLHERMLANRYAN